MSLKLELVNKMLITIKSKTEEQTGRGKICKCESHFLQLLLVTL